VRGPEERCRRRFLEQYPGGFADPAWRAERAGRDDALRRWELELARARFRARREARDFGALAQDMLGSARRCGWLEPDELSRLRAVVSSPGASRRLAEALYSLLYGRGNDPVRFTRWLKALRPLDLQGWPLATVFGGLAEPGERLFVRPSVIRRGAQAWGVELDPGPAPEASLHRKVQELGREMARALRDLGPADLLDVEAFLRLQVPAS
jgi:hypothetical protein